MNAFKRRDLHYEMKGFFVKRLRICNNVEMISDVRNRKDCDVERPTKIDLRGKYQLLSCVCRGHQLQ